MIETGRQATKFESPAPDQKIVAALRRPTGIFSLIAVKKILFLLTIAGMFSSDISSRGSAETPLGGPVPTATPKPSTVTFENVTVTDATNMSSKPKVTAESKLPAAKLKVK